MARVKGTIHNTAIPQIDILNAPTCLACPLHECVLFFQSDAIRRACPVWRKENERKMEYTRRWRRKKQAKEN